MKDRLQRGYRCSRNARTSQLHSLGRRRKTAQVSPEQGRYGSQYPTSSNQPLIIAPHQVIIWDDAKQKAVITLEFRSPVNRVCLSRTRIIVVLYNSVHMYAFSSPPEKLSVFETANNSFGLCCLGSKIVAFPGRTPGQVQLVEIGTGNVSIIPAHGTPLRAMEMSPDGEVLATASETVTAPLLNGQHRS